MRCRVIAQNNKKKMNAGKLSSSAVLLETEISILFNYFQYGVGGIWDLITSQYSDRPT